MSKRKRSEVDNDSADTPRKTRVLDNNTSTSTTENTSGKETKSKSAARQAKSERRSKKKEKPNRRQRPEPNPLPDGIDEDNDTTEHTTAVDASANHDETIPLEGQAQPKKPNPSKPKSKPKQKSTDETTSPANHRFILFIGNLPYKTTAPALNHHFRALQPFTVRHSTVPNSKPPKSKGFAFLEFTSYDRMKTCLKLYHHSLFDPDAHLTAAKDDSKSKKSDADKVEAPVIDQRPQYMKAPTDKTRRINVELTAGGGGGKSEARRTKIKNKNAKLAEERERVHKRETEEKDKKAVEDAAKKGNRRRATGANAAIQGVDGDAGEGADRGNVHPSRLRRVQA